MKLAMIGVRGHNGYILGTLDQLPEVEVAGVCSGCDDDISPLVTRLNDDGHHPKVFDDYCRMLDEVQPDLVTVAGPMELHATMCVAAIERGMHVFCEKPIALTLDELEAIEQAHAKHPHLRVWAMTGMRFDGEYMAAYDVIRSGRIGQVRMIDARKSYKLGQRPDYYKSRETYGGTIPWIGSHVIDLIHAMAQSSVSCVYATHTREGNRDHGDLEMAAHCQFVMTNGILANCSLDFLRPAAAPTHGDNRMRIVGSAGVIEVDNGQNQCIDDQGTHGLAPMPSQSIFVAFVRGEHDAAVPPVTTEEAFRITRACLLARESADTGHRIVVTQSQNQTQRTAST